MSRVTLEGLWVGGDYHAIGIQSSASAQLGAGMAGWILDIYKVLVLQASFPGKQDLNDPTLKVCDLLFTASDKNKSF